MALQDLPVIFALDRAGPVGQDGLTHNGVFDIAYMRTLPNMILGAPRDATDLDRMLGAALKADSPVAIRFPRGNAPSREEIHASEREPMVAGKAEVLRDGDEGGLCIWAYGVMVETALTAAAQLSERGLDVGVVDARFVKPLDEELLGAHPPATATCSPWRITSAPAASAPPCSRLPHGSMSPVAGGR